jgi:predicted aldo/keto reductase-like oxidoreductase
MFLLSLSTELIKEFGEKANIPITSFVKYIYKNSAKINKMLDEYPKEGIEFFDSATVCYHILINYLKDKKRESYVVRSAIVQSNTHDEKDVKKSHKKCRKLDFEFLGIK